MGINVNIDKRVKLQNGKQIMWEKQKEKIK